MHQTCSIVTKMSSGEVENVLHSTVRKMCSTCKETAVNLPGGSSNKFTLRSDYAILAEVNTKSSTSDFTCLSGPNLL